MLESLARCPSALTLHALGRFCLAEKDFDQAQRFFIKALESDPNNPQLHSDLGAAFFEQWNRQYPTSRAAESEELRISLNHLTEALELNSSLHEARFNRALLQASGQTQLAREEWRKYLAADPNSGWAMDAKRELDNLQKLR